MKKQRLSKSLRQFIRGEKAKIRKQFLSLEDQKRQIQECYHKIFNQ